jgi:hypothetical protein
VDKVVARLNASLEEYQMEACRLAQAEYDRICKEGAA